MLGFVCFSSQIAMKPENLKLLYRSCSDTTVNSAEVLVVTLWGRGREELLEVLALHNMTLETAL